MGGASLVTDGETSGSEYRDQFATSPSAGRHTSVRH
jgi:hypothetical protein